MDAARSGAVRGCSVASVVGFLAMFAGLVGLVLTRSLFSPHPAVIAAQVAAAALMIWARVTFGFRSFNLTAEPTEGGLVTSGPYAFVRHPIYAAILLFVAAAGAGHPSAASLACVAVVAAGAFARMLAEERELRQAYPEYAEYARRVKRVLPFVF